MQGLGIFLGGKLRLKKSKCEWLVCVGEKEQDGGREGGCLQAEVNSRHSLGAGDMAILSKNLYVRLCLKFVDLLCKHVAQTRLYDLILLEKCLAV